MHAHVSRKYIFDAAHKIECFGQGHKCGRLHGHTWEVEVSVAGEVNPATGIVIDYYEIDKSWGPVFAVIDHSYLNDIAGLELPTTENIASWIWARMAPTLKTDKHSLARLSIKEGASDRCEFFGG